MKPLFLILGIVASLAMTAMAQGDPPIIGGGLEAEARGADQTSPLGARQQRVKRLLNDLETKFTELANKLQEEQPEQAEKLSEAFKQSKDLLLMQRMDDITALLDGAKLESATDEQGQVVSDLKDLIDLLLYEETEYERLQREIEQLERWKQALDDLIQDEIELQEESETLVDPEAAQAALEAKIEKTKDLIAKQETLLESTEKNDGSDVDAMDELADDQAGLRAETEDLAGEMEASEPSEKSASGQQRAGESLKEATEHQGEAEDQLAQGKANEAGNAEREALKDLQAALEALEEEKARLQERDLEKAANELARQQSETAADTGKLGEEMAEAGESPEGEPSPGENVQNAQQQMNQASQQLGQNQPGQASKNQEQAVEELNAAREEVERQLNELRDQAQQEQIARLEEVFKKMLERQRLVTSGTKAIAERRGGEETRLRRADRIELRQWAKEERSLEENAKVAEQLLVDDGTSVVFRDVVGYLQQEIGSVSEMMEHQDTGPLVQQAHLEIESTLEELVAALENSGAGQGQQPPGQPQPGGGEQERQSLFPPLAELKLLKFTQERINRQTKTIEVARGKVDPEVEDILGTRLKSAAEIQNQLTNMTRQLASKIQPTMTQEDPNAID